MWNLTQECSEFRGGQISLEHHAGAPKIFIEVATSKVCVIALAPSLFNDNMRDMRFIGIISLLSIIVLAFVLSSTNPSTINPAGILLVYLLMYTSCLGVVTYFLYYGSAAASNLVNLLTGKMIARLSRRRAYLFGSVIAIAPVVLIAIQSISSVGITDFGLVILFEILACFYVWRRS